MAININTILDWFKSGKKPTEQQFADSWKSFWHKDDSIPQTAIENLETTLDEKATHDELEAHINDLVPYTGATGPVDLGTANRMGAGYVGGGYGDGTNVPARLATRNPTIPVTGTTSTVFGVYNSTGARSLHVYADETDKHHVNNRGGDNSSVTNSAFGVGSLSNYTVGSIVNTAIGYYSLGYLAGGASSRNTSIGSYAGTKLTSGNFNTLVGAHVAYNATVTEQSFDRNTLIGQAAGDLLTTGRKNTFIGRSAGSGVTTGISNVIVTHGWGNEEVPYNLGLSTGSYNTLIGYAKDLSPADSNWIVLADGQGNRAFEKNGSTGVVNITGTSITFNGSLIRSAGGLLHLGQYTTATAPAYTKGAAYFDTTLNKLRIGGASAWETVTSS
ncbi:hypothetical protein ACLI1A_11630 [Flavobacterium sp. RHBU_3]|uniref:hypothetical protein n=1 Tax=Flavobacterium sp. RHBU_3 TaxID=3391184 RepID=UPI00398511E7